MSIASIRNLLFKKVKTLLSGASYTVADESIVIVNKTVGSATAIVLPPTDTLTALSLGTRVLLVADGKGDAGTNNITLTAAGADTINGAATYVISANYGSVWLTDCGGVWQASTSLSGSSLTSLTVTNANVINLVTNGVDANADVAGVNAAGSVIGNATALTHAVNVVSGADDAKGVQLPASGTGKLVEIYNQDSNGTHGLKVYPAVNSTINNASANAAIVIEGWTRAVFRGISNSAWAASYTVNA